MSGAADFFVIGAGEVGRRIGAALRDAARRGEAEIMLGERSDVPVSRWASERLFTRFLRAGLRIYCYRPQVVHAKALVLDDNRTSQALLERLLTRMGLRVEVTSRGREAIEKLLDAARGGADQRPVPRR